MVRVSWRDPHAPLICTTTLQRRNNARTRQIRITEEEEEEEVYPHVRHYIHHVVKGNNTKLYIWHSTITITNGETLETYYVWLRIVLFYFDYLICLTPQCTSKCQTNESALIVTDYSTLHYDHYMLLWQSHLIQSCCISITYHHGSTKRYQKLGTTRHTIEQRLVVEPEQHKYYPISPHYWSQIGLYCRIVPPKGVPL
jgi:hypothetical protein